MVYKKDDLSVANDRLMGRSKHHHLKVSYGHRKTLVYLSLPISSKEILLELKGCGLHVCKITFVCLRIELNSCSFHILEAPFVHCSQDSLPEAIVRLSKQPYMICMRMSAIRGVCHLPFVLYPTFSPPHNYCGEQEVGDNTPDIQRQYGPYLNSQR